MTKRRPLNVLADLRHCGFLLICAAGGYEFTHLRAPGQKFVIGKDESLHDARYRLIRELLAAQEAVKP